MKFLKLSALILSVSVIAGCSGGQGSAPTASTPAPVTPTPVTPAPPASTADLLSFTANPTNGPGQAVTITCAGTLNGITEDAGHPGDVVIPFCFTSATSFNGSILVSVGALPPGVINTTNNPSQNPAVFPVGQTWLNAKDGVGTMGFSVVGAAPGTYAVTFSAVPTDLTDLTPIAGQSAINSTVSFVIPPAATPPAKPDFSVSWTPVNLSIVANQGGPLTDNETLSLTPLNGFTDAVYVSVPEGAPSGMTVYTGAVVGTSFEWSSSQPLTMSIFTDSTVQNGVYPVSVTVTDPSVTPTLSHTATVNVTVTGAAPPVTVQPSFTLSASPATITVYQQNGPTNVPLTISSTAVGGFTGNIALTLTMPSQVGFPGGNCAGNGLGTSVCTVSSVVNPLAAGASTTLQFLGAAVSNPNQGTYPVTITGTAPGVSTPVTATFNLVIAYQPTP